MKTIKHLLFLLCPLAACSCNTGDAGPEITRITGTILKDGDIPGLFRILYYDGHNLITHSSAGDHPLCTYEITGDELSSTGNYLHKGRGPGELTAPSFYADTDGIHCIANSMIHDYIYRYSLRKDTLLTAERNDISWIKPFFSDSFVHIGDGRYLVSGGRTGTESILSVIDISRKKVEALNFWPEDGYGGNNIFGKQISYCGNSCIAANRNKIMYAAPYGLYLDIMTVDGDEIIKHNVIYDDLPDLSDSDKSGFGIIPDSEHHGIKAMATSNYIYAVRLGNVLQEGSGSVPPGFNNAIEVFDWDGNLLRRYITDRPFVLFSAAADDSSLITYGLSDEETQELSLSVYPLDLK